MFKQLLANQFAPYGTLSELQIDQLESHYNLLCRWNEKLNLTRIRDLEDAVCFHYCESLFAAKFLSGCGHRIVDVGSGGGFPGIPIAVFRPDCEITLVESHQRKAVFLRECSRNLKNVRVVSCRAEDIADPFDWVVSRAVVPSQILKLALAKNIALLIGRRDAGDLIGVAHPVPWGNDRVLFHVELAR